MKISIGCDEAALDLKELIKAHLQTQSQVHVEVQDFGVHCCEPVDYPDIAVQVAEAVARGVYERGILLCGTGIGMAIAANKVVGIRAATCHDVYSAERAQKSNNAQIITLGARGGTGIGEDGGLRVAGFAVFRRRFDSQSGEDHAHRADAPPIAD